MQHKDYHWLLKKQLKQARFTAQELSKFTVFFNAINHTYETYDEDIEQVESILKQSTDDLFETRKMLQDKVQLVESQLNSVVNNIEGVIFKTDLQGNFSYLNKAWETLTDVPIDKALNSNYKDLLIGINKKEKDRLSKFFRDRQTDYTTVFKYFKPSGDKIWMQLRFVLEYDRDDQPIGTMGILTDVTDLRETQIKLDKANKSKDLFLSTMSHEIRTPLNAVVGMSEILLMEKFLPEQLENLQVLKYSSEHLLSLINDILDLNRLQSKTIGLDEEDFNLAELLQHIKLHYKLSASSKKIFFKTHFDENISFMLKGDSIKLTQVLKNLLSNAFKFTHKGGVILSAKCIESYNGLQKIRFSIKDTGIGMTYDEQKRIFKSYMQANKDSSRLYGGSRLGLSITKQLLKLFNTKLKLQSGAGEGSLFWFDINFKTSNKQVVFNTNYIAKTEQVNLKVLVADDNHLNRLLLKKLFHKWGVTYKVAENGQELVDIYENEDFDLILMDIQMPVLDGYQATKIIRSMADDGKSMIPIIALTAFTKSEIEAKSAEYKMNGYMSKPFNVNELHNLLSFYSRKLRQVV